MLNLVSVNDCSVPIKLAKPIPTDVIVLRRMRIFRKVTREDAARVLGREPKIMERFENGRQSLSIERKKLLVRRYRYNWEDYLSFLAGTNELPDLPIRSIFKSRATPRTEGRKYQKKISKEARVLKVLRNMKGWAQPMAAEKCGWSRSCIDHLENGRVELTEEKVAHVLSSYGCSKSLYDELFEAPMLRDEVITECLSILTKLDNDKLRAVKALLDNFR
jgi:transcriptional regulator with XRE-family HTH domain